MTFNQRTLRKPEVVSHEVYSNTFKYPTACYKIADKKKSNMTATKAAMCKRNVSRPHKKLPL